MSPEHKSHFFLRHPVFIVEYCLDCYLTHCWYQDYHQTDDKNAGKEDAVQFQPAKKSRLVVLDSHLESLIRCPAQGLLVCRTVGTTVTPGIIEINGFTLEDSIFIHLCSAPGLKIITSLVSIELYFRFNSKLDLLELIKSDLFNICRYLFISF